jgi:hypothetical protein
MATDPLYYQNRVRFPRDLERAYRQDYAMPRTREIAWLLRATLEPFVIGLFWLSYRPSCRIKMYWLINLWVLAMNFTILWMIYVSQESELAFTFYPIGLMLAFICGYVASGHLWYAATQGWLAIIGYILVGIFDQRMLAGPSTLLKFFTLNFFLVRLNLIGMALGYALERTNGLAFLQRLVIDQQHRESDRLLLNVLPASIAARLKRGEAVADHFDQVSILFADIEGFTPLTACHKLLLSEGKRSLKIQFWR